jgi:hypothetical protein
MIIKKIILFILTGVLLTGSSFDIPEPSNVEEYAIKAAFIYRFIDYVEWSNYDGDRPFNIAILGNSGITRPLMEIASDKKAKDNRIIVKQYNDVNSIGSCQILFVSRNSDIPVESIISKMEDKPLLIITEQKGACEKGAHINFLISENKLKFEVNLTTVSRSGLKISSQLLQHASVIMH